MSYMTQFDINAVIVPIQTLTGDNGIAVVPTAGNIDVLGGDLITTSGAASTLTVSLDNGTDGQVIIGSTAGSPAYGTITSLDASVTIALGSNTIDLSVASVLPLDVMTDSGTATESGGEIKILGGTGISTSAAGNAVTVTLDTPVTVANGGTGLTTITDHGVMVGSGAGAVTPLAVGTDGQVLVGATGADPAMATLTSADGSVVFATGANTLDLTVDAAASGAIDGIIPDSGISPVVPDASGDMTFTGGTTGLTFVGGTNTVKQSGTLVVANGGTGATTLTGVLTGNGTSAVTANAVTQYTVLVGGASNAVSEVSGVGTSGQVLTSNGAGSNPTWQDSSGGGLTWNEETGTSATMSVDNGYIANNASLVTLTLPTTAALGSIIRVVGKGAGGWQIAQNASEIIHFGTSDTTTGATGYLESTQTYDAVHLVCTVADTEWTVLSSVGNLTIN